MKAVQFEELGKPLRVADVPKPTADPGALVFKVKACGICASDLHAVEIPGLLQPGNVLGHEYSGEVVEVGKGIEGWKVGFRPSHAENVPHVERAAIQNVVELSCRALIRGCRVPMPSTQPAWPV